MSTGFRNSDLISNNKENGPDKESGGRDRKDKGNKDRDNKDKDNRDRDAFGTFGGREKDGDRERGFGGGGRGRGRNNRGQLPPRMARGK